MNRFIVSRYKIVKRETSVMSYFTSHDLRLTKESLQFLQRFTQFIDHFIDLFFFTGTNT
jgi:hypothetical protein